MYEKVETCPVCKSSNFKNHIICTDHSISGESFALTQCNNCSLILTNPRPDINQIGQYYESEDYISHADKSNSLINTIYRLVRNYTIRKKFKLVSSYANKKSLFDFGCGTGDFLNYLKQKSWEVSGFEPSKLAADKSKSKGISLIENITTGKDKFGIVTAWHVLEHVPDPAKTLKLLRKKTIKGGFIFIAVPNPRSYDANHYDEFWAGYDVPRHLSHFTRNSFGQLVKKSKLTLVDTLPMKFDSYYISMLSEKYKFGKINYFRAFKTGWISNQKANKTGEYSSLIYVLKK
ncbi:MAG: class I SAM-dependent methyltransferase [Ekhidna sp.]